MCCAVQYDAMCCAPMRCLAMSTWIHLYNTLKLYKAHYWNQIVDDMGFT